MSKQVTDIRLAVTLYYTRTSLNTKDIKALFGITNNSLVTRLKNEARKVMREEGVSVFDKCNVEPDCAYRAWGLDIAKLERSIKKMKSLGLFPENDGKDVRADVKS